MKHIFRLIRLVLLAVLLLITVSTAVYRLDPETVSGAESSTPLSELLTGAIAQTVSDLTQSAGGAAQSAGQSAADSAIGTVADVTPTGNYTADGQQLLQVEVPVSTVPVLKNAASQQLGGTLTTEQLVEQLNAVSGVSASENEDGSLSMTVPQNVYDSYKSQLTGYLGG